MPLSQTQKTAQVKCEDCPIRHRAVCSKCEGAELDMLESIKSYRSYQPGEAIVWAGEKIQLTGSVVEGVAMLLRTLPDGRRQMVGLLLPSDFLGRPGRDVAKFDVVAATPVTFCMFRKADFERIVAKSPQIEHRLLEMTLDELDSAREWMLLLGRKTAREKIAGLVRFGIRDSGVVVHEEDGVRIAAGLLAKHLREHAIFGVREVESVHEQTPGRGADGRRSSALERESVV